MTEAEKARAWRNRIELTIAQLSEQVGYSVESIWWFEQGRTPTGETPKPWVFLRYKRACGDVDAELNGRKKGERFEW